MTLTALSEFDSLVAQMVARGVPRDRAEETARAHLGMVQTSALEQLRAEAEIHELESDVEQEGDRLMQSLGFFPVRLSQRRASKVTAGIPDRYYVHERRKLVVWWEAKAQHGRARPEQLQFQRLHQNAGVNHVLGPLDALRTWLERAGVVSGWEPNGLPIPTPIPE